MLKNVLHKGFMKVFYAKDDIKIVQSVFRAGLMSKEDVDDFLSDYIRNGYRWNNLDMVADLSRRCGYGVSILGISKFYKDHVDK